MGRFLFFVCVITLVTMSSNIVVGFLTAVVSLIVLDAFLIATGRVKTRKGHYHSGHSRFSGTEHIKNHGVNPATGLPMVNSSMDVGGNIFGTSNTDFHSQDHFDNKW